MAAGDKLRCWWSSGAKVCQTKKSGMLLKKLKFLLDSLSAFTCRCLTFSESHCCFVASLKNSCWSVHCTGKLTTYEYIHNATNTLFLHENISLSLGEMLDVCCCKYCTLVYTHMWYLKITSSSRFASIYTKIKKIKIFFMLTPNTSKLFCCKIIIFLLSLHQVCGFGTFFVDFLYLFLWKSLMPFFHFHFFVRLLCSAGFSGVAIYVTMLLRLLTVVKIIFCASKAKSFLCFQKYKGVNFRIFL